MGHSTAASTRSEIESISDTGHEKYISRLGPRQRHFLRKIAFDEGPNILLGLHIKVRRLKMFSAIVPFFSLLQVET